MSNDKSQPAVIAFMVIDETARPMVVVHTVETAKEAGEVAGRYSLQNQEAIVGVYKVTRQAGVRFIDDNN